MADEYIKSLGSGTGSQSGGGPAAGTTADILRNQVLSRLTLAIENMFPQATASVTMTATAGDGTVPLPAAPVGFLTVTISGTGFKIPLYGM